MFELNKAFEKISDDELKELLDIPVWLALMAAYKVDGKVSENERAEAVKLAHLRTFTAPKPIQEFYEKVDERFEQRFDILNARLPKDEHDRDLYLQAQVKGAHAMIVKLDHDVAETLEKSLESFYEHVYKADSSFFQYFALPVISNRLESKSGKYDIK